MSAAWFVPGCQKFSVADTDHMIALAKQRMTCWQISKWFKENRRVAATPDEIEAVCKEARCYVQWGRP